MRQIEAVAFDLGSVVLDIDKDKVVYGLASYSKYSEAELHAILDLYSLQDNEVLKLFHQALYDADTGKIFPRDFFEVMVRVLQFKPELSSGLFYEIWKKMLLVNDNVYRLAKTLNKFGIRLGIISDLGLIHYTKLMQLNRDGKFDFSMFIVRWFSFLDGHLKSENGGRVFREFAVNMQTIPRKILFIDDREINIKVASDCGFRTFHYIGEEKYDKLLNYVMKLIA